MKTVVKFVALLALAGTIIPAVLFALKLMGEQSMKGVLLVSAVAWFAAAPFWLNGGEN